MSEIQASAAPKPSGIMLIDFKGWAIWLVLIEYVIFAALPYTLNPTDLAAWASLGIFASCVLLTFVPFIRWAPFTLGALLLSLATYQFFCRYVRIGETYSFNETGLLYSTHPVPYLASFFAFGFAIWLHTLIVDDIKESFAEANQEWAEDNGYKKEASVSSQTTVVHDGLSPET